MSTVLHLKGRLDGRDMATTPIRYTPNSFFDNPGNGQERKYGADGWPEYDIDWNHSHRSGIPHGHNWTNRARGPSVELCPFPRGRGPTHRSKT